MSSSGPKAPILVKGDAGFGKSLLLAKWLVLLYSLIFYSSLIVLLLNEILSCKNLEFEQMGKHCLIAFL